MNFDRDEKTISDALDTLNSDIKTPDLMQGILSKMHDARAPKSKRRLLRPVIIAAAIVALLGGTAVAAVNGGFDWLLGETEVPFGDVIEETYQTVSSNGIDISIIAQKSYGDMSVLYLLLKDAEGLGRVGEETHISYKKDDIVKSSSSNLLYFDSKTGIAAFELRLGAMETFEAQTLQLDIEGIGYGERTFDEMQTGIDLAKAVAKGENIGEPHENDMQVPGEKLTVGHIADIEGADSAWISSIGVLSGYLTVQIGQTLVDDNSLEDNYLQPYLLDSEGNIIEPKPFKSGFVRTEDMEEVEDISQAAFTFSQSYFDIDTGNLEGYTLCLKGQMQKWCAGDWKFNISFDSISEVKEITADINVNGVQMDNVKLTLHPLGMVFVGKGVPGDDYSSPLFVDVVIETANGHVKLEGKSASRPHPDGEFKCIWQAPSSIDMATVTAINIGDNRIAIQQI